MEPQQFNVRLNPHVIRLIKAYAALQDITAADYISKLVLSDKDSLKNFIDEFMQDSTDSVKKVLDLGVSIVPKDGGFKP